MKWEKNNLSIGGLNTEIRSSGKSPFFGDRRFKPFQGPSNCPDIIMQFQLVRSSRCSQGSFTSIFHALSNRKIGSWKKKELTCSTLAHDGLQKAEKQSSWLACETRNGSLTLLDFKKSQVWQFFDSASAAGFTHHGIGPAMFALFLPKFNSLMLHASAIVRQGRAAVFLAPDEGGKTTAVRLSPGGTILCDDQVLVRRVRGRFRVWGTPWGLHVDARANAPLAGLFLLKKGKRFSLAPLPARELIPFIWEEIRNPLTILPKPLKQKAFGILCNIARSAPCWTMSFPKGHIDWDAVDRALAKQVGST